MNSGRNERITRTLPAKTPDTLKRGIYQDSLNLQTPKESRIGILTLVKMIPRRERGQEPGQDQDPEAMTSKLNEDKVLRDYIKFCF